VEAIAISPVVAKVVNDAQCVGCKLCTIACPYGTIFYDAERGKAFKCDLCGGNPACAAACPTQAIVYVEDETQDWIGAFAAQRSFIELSAIA
jgi:Fe-S-cluster-containing hydrogenase component 2